MLVSGVLLLAGLQGEITALMSGNSTEVQTDTNGQFVFQNPAAARFKFGSNFPNSDCRDSVTGVQITFPMQQDVPLTAATTFTAISLLTRPAKSDPSVLKNIPKSQRESLVPAYLWTHVYGLYGFDAQELDVDFLSFTGTALHLSSPRAAQVIGAIAQTMSTYTSAYAVLGGLFDGQVSSDSLATCIIGATYDVLTDKKGTLAATVLTSIAGINQIYEKAYDSCAPQVGRCFVARLLSSAQLLHLSAFCLCILRSVF